MMVTLQPTSYDEVHARKNELDSYLASTPQLDEKEIDAAVKDLQGIKDNPCSLRVMSSLQELDAHLGVIKNDTAYERAEALDLSYVTNKDFRFLFLRSRQFDARSAAQQMIDFFNLKESLFGTDKLVTDITLKDLDDEAIAHVREGSIQILRARDNAGRPILVNFPCKRTLRSKESELRARYYIVMCALNSEDARNHGLTTIYFGCNPVDRYDSHSRYLGPQAYMIFNILPVHFASLHGCFSNIVIYTLLAAAIFVLPEKYKVRLRIHYGNSIESQNALENSGLPPDSLPLSPDGSVLLDDHLQWFNERIKNETATTATTSTEDVEMMSCDGDYDFVETPLPTDVLFGKGRSKNGGNVLLRQILEEYQTEYENADKQRKVMLSDIIVCRMKEANARFLKFDESAQQWREVSYKEAHDKVAHGFRNRRRYK